MADLALPVIDRADPGYQRHCIRPDCTAAFNVLDVMDGRASAAGWRLFRAVINGYICPRHAGPVIDGGHLPSWIRVPGFRYSSVGIACSCGWEWRPRNPPVSQGEHQAEWVAHLASLDPEVSDE